MVEPCQTCGCKPAICALSGIGWAEVDFCISDLVMWLNEKGYPTKASCCGHGWLPGTIMLQDGQELRLMNFDTARWLDSQFPWNIHGEVRGWQDPGI